MRMGTRRKDLKENRKDQKHGEIKNREHYRGNDVADEQPEPLPPLPELFEDRHRDGLK